MNTFKKLFSKSSAAKGILTVSNKTYKDIEIAIDAKGLFLKGYSDLLISIDDISDLFQNDNVVSFLNKENKYYFELKDIEHTKTLFEQLNKHIKEVYVFNTDNVFYYLYNVETKTFDKHENKTNIKIIDKDGYFLRISDDLKLLHYELIKTKTQYYLDEKHKSFVWSVFNDGSFHTFCIEFNDNVDFLDFCSKYVECCYKSVNNEGNYEYFKNISTVSLNTEVKAEDQESEDWCNYEAQEPVKNEFNSNTKVNGKLVVGNNQVFVSRGSSLGVFDVTADDLTFRTHIQNSLNNPDKILTYNQDQSLLILDKDCRNKLQLLDLNKGQVIEKWDVETDMNDCFNSLKNNNQQTLIGLSDHSLFRIDPRSKNKVVEKKEYKTKNEFSCGLSTDKGDVAVASKKGDLRLYNKIDKRAKSLLPGFGDEILGIDSSNNGSLILCTCQNYILLYSVGTDYSKAIGKEKPTPRRLQLKPQHLSLMVNDVCFTPAKFDTDDNLIVTSTGRYVIKWQVKDVLEGKVYNYSLKALYDVIVDENFVFNGNDIVIALQNDVKKINEKDLGTPN